MNAQGPDAQNWPTAGTRHIPFGVYNNADLHQTELDSYGLILVSTTTMTP